MRSWRSSPPICMQVPGIVRAFGAEVKACFLREQEKWQPDLDALRAQVSDRTKLIYVTNPNNPTGSILSEEARGEIVRIADSVGAWLLADEVYRGAELQGDPSPSFWGTYPKALIVAGLSKAYT